MQLFSLIFKPVPVNYGEIRGEKAKWKIIRNSYRLKWVPHKMSTPVSSVQMVVSMGQGYRWNFQLLLERF